jgi:hypothetical protein
MAISLNNLRTTFGGSTPISLNSYYQGGTIMGPGVYPATVPSAGAISLSNFIGVPQQYNWGHNQQTSGNQSNDGAGWTVDYILGPLGWGLYATVWYYTGGQQVSPLTAYATSQYIKFGAPNVTVTSNPNGNVSQTVPPSSTGNTPAAGPTGGVLSPGSDSRYGDGIYWLGYITGYWDGAGTVYIGGSYGSGGPGDRGYAYATGQVRGNWSALSGGSNTVAVGI